MLFIRANENEKLIILLMFFFIYTSNLVSSLNTLAYVPYKPWVLSNIHGNKNIINLTQIIFTKHNSIT